MCAVEQSLLCLEHTDVVRETASTDNHDDDDDSLCTARSECRRAFQCRTLLTDDRVLANLLATEHRNRPSADCFCRQTEVLPYMRDTVVTWMLEVRFLSLLLPFTSRIGLFTAGPIRFLEVSLSNFCSHSYRFLKPLATKNLYRPHHGPIINNWLFTTAVPTVTRTP